MQSVAAILAMSESGASSPLLGKGTKPDQEEAEKESDNKTSSLQAFFNIFNANMGTGVLAMPYVMRLTGYWGIILIILVAALGNYTGKLLIYCLREDTAYEKSTYADLGEAFWPRYGRVMVHITNFAEQFSHCSLFLIMCGTVLHHTFPDIFVSESVWISRRVAEVFKGVFVLTGIFIKGVIKSECRRREPPGGSGGMPILKSRGPEMLFSTSCTSIFLTRWSVK